MGFSLFRFLHAADIHLDSPLRGLERYADAPVDEIRAAPRRALENLVQFAIDRDVAFLLIAGDLYDGDWKDYNTGIFFVRQMRRLEAAGIPVHLIAGNHDAASQITKELSLPPNVTLYSRTRPQTTELPELGVAIHGQSFATRAVKDDLAAGYPMGEPGRFDIGLLHTSLDGRPGHDTYAPTSIGELIAKDYDYWALGHVHRREVAHQEPWVVFPGNLQGRHARETGAKGATLVTVEDGAVKAVSHQALDVVRWARIEVDLADVERAEAVPERVREVVGSACSDEAPLLALRLVLQGRTRAHEALNRTPERWIHEIRSELGSLAGGVFVERILFETRTPLDLDAELGRDDALGDLLRSIASLEDASVDLDDYVDSFKDLKKKLPATFSTEDDGFDPTDPEALRKLLPGVRDLLVDRLLGAEVGAEVGAEEEGA